MVFLQQVLQGNLGQYMKLDSAAADAAMLLPDPTFPHKHGSLFDILNKCKTKVDRSNHDCLLYSPDCVLLTDQTCILSYMHSTLQEWLPLRYPQQVQDQGETSVHDAQLVTHQHSKTNHRIDAFEPSPYHSYGPSQCDTLDSMMICSHRALVQYDVMRLQSLPNCVHAY